jgi:hypothetical protein
VSFKSLNFREPSVLRGVITAVVALLASIGVVVSTDVTGAAEALIPVAAVVIPLVQSLWTRAAVFSPKAVAQIAGKHEAPEV